MKTKRAGRIGLVALINACTALIVLIAFSPHLIPFLAAEPQKFILPVSNMAEATDPTAPATAISGKPVRIRVPSVGIDVEVVDGIYDESSSTWTLAEKQAHYAVMTSPANDKAGNTFIYGHNNKHVFGKLLKSSIGAEAIIETDNGKLFTYKLTSFQDVKPRDVAALQNQDHPVLTVQTCSGRWSENRRLFTFDFVKVEDKL